MKQTFNITPSFLFKIMKHCSNLESDLEVINAFERIASLNKSFLTGDDADIFDQDAEDMEDVPDHLVDLSYALEGAISSEDEDDADDDA